MKKIAIFQSNLSVGGIQKSLINLLQNIDTSKYQIDLYLFEKQTFFDVEIPKDINVIIQKKSPKISKFIYFDLYKKIKKNIYNEREYDVAIDFDSYQFDTAFGAISVKAKKRVIWIHNDVEIKIKNEIKYRILHYFFKGKYKYFDEYVAVSKGIVEPFRRTNKTGNKTIHVIPNYINTKEIIEKSTEKSDLQVDKNKYNLVTMGRICHQKGFDILVNKMKEITDQRKDIHLYIIGDGPDREKINHLIEENQLKEYITLLGNQKNPFKYMKDMDGFVLTSRYEGQGMVILEAKCLGLEIFITKNLEKYNENIDGYEDIVRPIIDAKRKDKKVDKLEEYNSNITKKIESLLEK